MASKPLRMAPQTRAQQVDPFTKVPTELVERMVGYTDKNSFLAFRQTSRATQEKSARDFGIRFYSHVNVPLLEPNLENCVPQIANWSDYVKSIRLMGVQKRKMPSSRLRWYALSESEITLLRNIVRRCRSVETLKFSNCNERIGAAVARAFSSAPLPSLVTLKLSSVALSTNGLLSVLRPHQGTLKGLQLWATHFTQNSWREALRWARDEASLTHFYYLCCDSTELRDPVYTFAGGQRHDRILRNPETGKFEVYTLRSGLLEMKGAYAIRAGVNKFFAVTEDEYFDASLA